jgi:hypothetical protein
MGMCEKISKECKLKFKKIKSFIKKKMLYSALVYVTFAVKIAFIISILSDKYLLKFQPSNAELIKKFALMKGQLDFVFILLMSVILIVNFGPWVTYVNIDTETKILFFVYGIIMPLEADYTTFFNQSVFFQYFKKLSF